MVGIFNHLDDLPMYNEDQGSYSFPISRMFENTSDAIRAKLTPLNKEVLAYIEKLPTLFISELNIDSDNKEKITLRVGTISDLKLLNRSVSFSFNISQKYDAIHVEDKKLYQDKLELNGILGLSRHHWGVKDSDLNDVLQKLGIRHDNIPTPGLQTLPNIDDHHGNGIKNIQEFMAFVLNYNHDDDEELFYRGHSDFSYELSPSVFRKNEKGNYIYLYNESSLVREALTARPNEFVSDKTMFDKLVRMQHYGLPTRLLDITSNPLIALYFACSEIKRDRNNNEIDGHVIIFKVKRNTIKFFDSDTVSCISNLSMLKQALKDKLDSKLDREEFNNNNNGCSELLHYIKNEKPYFKDLIIPKDLEKILFVKARLSNERILSQSGAFLLFGNNAVYPDLIPNNDTDINQEFKVEKLVITNKEDIIKDLKMLNITNATVYQGMETTMKLIAEKIAILPY